MKIKRDGKWASVVIKISKKLDGLDGELVREEEEEFIEFVETIMNLMDHATYEVTVLEDK